MAVAVTLLTLACGSREQQSGQHSEPGRELRPVSLPDLSRVAESVALQLRERYAALTAIGGNAAIAVVDRAAAYQARWESC